MILVIHYSSILWSHLKHWISEYWTIVPQGEGIRFPSASGHNIFYLSAMREALCLLKAYIKGYSNFTKYHWLLPGAWHWGRCSQHCWFPPLIRHMLVLWEEPKDHVNVMIDPISFYVRVTPVKLGNRSGWRWKGLTDKQLLIQALVFMSGMDTAQIPLY